MTAQSLVLVCPERCSYLLFAGCKQQQVPYEGCSIGTLASLRRDNIRHSWRALLAPFGAPEPSPAAAACAASGAAPASALAFPQSEELQVDNLVVVWPECTSCTTMLGNTCLGASGSPAAQPGPSLSTCCAECSPNSALAQQQQELLQLLTPIVEQQRQQGQEEQEEECAATAGLIALAADLASGADQYTPQQLQAIHTLPSLPHSKLPGVSYLCIQVGHLQAATKLSRGRGVGAGSAGQYCEGRGPDTCQRRTRPGTAAIHFDQSEFKPCGCGTEFGLDVGVWS